MHAPTAEPPAASEHAQLGLGEKISAYAKVILGPCSPNQNMEEFSIGNDPPKQVKLGDPVHPSIF